MRKDIENGIKKHHISPFILTIPSHFASKHPTIALKKREKPTASISLIASSIIQKTPTYTYKVGLSHTGIGGVTQTGTLGVTHTEFRDVSAAYWGLLPQERSSTGRTGRRPLSAGEKKVRKEDG